MLRRWSSYRKQLFVKMTNGKSIHLRYKPSRVWTWFDNEKPKLPVIMVHHENGFLEDEVHDWRWFCGRFHYYPHSSSKGDVVWVVLEFEKE